MTNKARIIKKYYLALTRASTFGKWFKAVKFIPENNSKVLISEPSREILRYAKYKNGKFFLDYDIAYPIEVSPISDFNKWMYYRDF